MMQKFIPSEMFRLRHSLVALVEELKLRKKCETDNENKIQELVNQTHILQRALDTEQERARQMEEEFERTMNELKQEHENRLKRLDADQRQRCVKAECNVYVEDKMKEEMKQLQMTIFHQEKSIKELETKLQTQESSSEKTLSQWESIQRKIAALTETYQSTLDSMTRLKRDVMTAVTLNKKLSYLNHHHECQMRDKCSEINRLQQEILMVKSEISTQPLEIYELEDKKGTIDMLNLKIKNLEDLVEKQNEEVEHQSERAKQAIESLQNAHALVNKHLERANKCWAENQKISEERAALAVRCNTMKSQLSMAEENLERLKLSTKKSAEEWSQKEDELEGVIKTKSQQLQALEESKAELEELNSKLSGRHEELSLLLAEAKKKLDVAKTDIGVLVGSSLFSISDRGLQTSPDVQNMTTQTLCSETVHVRTQTDHQATLSTLVQTDEATTISEVSQILKVFTTSDSSNQIIYKCHQPVPAVVADLCASSREEHQALVKMDHFSSSTSNYHNDRSLDLGEVKLETTVYSDCVPEGNNHSISDYAQEGGIKQMNESNRESYIPTDDIVDNDNPGPLYNFPNVKPADVLSAADVPDMTSGSVKPFFASSLRTTVGNTYNAGVFSGCLYEAPDSVSADTGSRSDEVCVNDSANVKVKVGVSRGRRCSDVSQLYSLKQMDHLQPVVRIKRMDHLQPGDHFQSVGHLQPVGQAQPVGHHQTDHVQSVDHTPQLDHIQATDYIQSSNHLQPNPYFHSNLASTVFSYNGSSLNEDENIVIPHTIQHSRTVSPDLSHTKDHNSNSNNNNEKKIVITANTQHVFTSCFINGCASTTVQDADKTYSKISSLDVKAISMDIQYPCVRLPKLATLSPSINIEDSAHVKQENKLIPYCHESSFLSDDRNRPHRFRGAQSSTSFTRDETAHPKCVKQVQHSLKLNEKGNKMLERLWSNPEPKLGLSRSVSVLNVDVVPSFSADYRIMYKNDGTAALSPSSGQALRSHGRHVRDHGIVQSSDVAAACGDIVQSSDTSNIDTALCYDTANLCEDKETKKESSSFFQLTQASSSTVPKPLSCLNTENYAKHERGCPTEAEDENQSVSSLPSPKCIDPYSFETEENLTSKDTFVDYSRRKRAPYSLKLAKPGRAPQHSFPSSTVSFVLSNFSQLMPSIAVSSNTVTRADLATPQTTPLYPHKDLSLPASSTAHVSPAHQEKENTSLLHPNMSTVSSNDIHGLSINQMSSKSIQSKLRSLNKSPLYKASNTSNRGIRHKVHNSHNVSSLDYQLSLGGSESKKCSELVSAIHKQNEKSSYRSGSRNKRYQMMFLPSPVTKSNQSVISLNREMPKSETKAKGILKGPSCKRAKSLTSKSVTFPQELEHHMHGLTPETQDSQQTSTTFTSSTTSFIHQEVKDTNCSYEAPLKVTEKSVICATDQEAASYGDTSISIQHNSDIEVPLVSNGSPASSNPNRSSRGLTAKLCFTIPETPNLEISDTECEVMSSPVSAAASLESPVVGRCPRPSKHSHDDVDDSKKTPAIEVSCSTVKKQKC